MVSQFQVKCFYVRSLSKSWFGFKTQSFSISSMQSNIICTTKIDLIVGNLQAPYILYESFNFISKLLFIVRCTSTNLSHVHWSELRLRQVFVLGSAPLLSCVLRCLTWDLKQRTRKLFYVTGLQSYRWGEEQ